MMKALLRADFSNDKEITVIDDYMREYKNETSTS